MRSGIVKGLVAYGLCISIMLTDIQLVDASITNQGTEAADVLDMNTAKPMNTDQTSAKEGSELPNDDINETDQAVPSEKPSQETEGQPATDSTTTPTVAPEAVVSPTEIPNPVISPTVIPEPTISPTVVPEPTITPTVIPIIPTDQDQTEKLTTIQSTVSDNYIEEPEYIETGCDIAKSGQRVIVYIPKDLFPDSNEFKVEADIIQNDDVVEQFMETLNEELEITSYIKEVHGYDIKLYVDGTLQEQLPDSVKVAFSGCDVVNTSTDESTVEVYYFDKDEAIVETMPSEEIDDETIVMETTHFSEYFVTEIEKKRYTVSPMKKSDIMEKLKMALPFSVYANVMTCKTHMEGTLNVDTLNMESGQVGNTEKVSLYTPNYTLQVRKKMNAGGLMSGSFRFGLFQKKGEEYQLCEDLNRGHIKNGLFTVQTDQTGVGQTTLSQEDLVYGSQYYIYEVKEIKDEQGHIIYQPCLETNEYDGATYTLTYSSDSLVETPNTISIGNSTTYINHLNITDNYDNWFQNGSNGEVPTLVLGNGNRYTKNSDGNKIVITTDKNQKCSVSSVVNVKQTENGYWEEFSSSFKTLEDVSTGLANLQHSDEIKVICIEPNANGMIGTLYLEDGNLITLSDMNEYINKGLYSGKTSEGNKKLLVINVDCTNYSMTNPLNLYGTMINGKKDAWTEEAADVIWNFVKYDSTGKRFVPYDGQLNTNNDIIGTVVAPKATVIEVAGNIIGAVIANTFSHDSGEVHHIPLHYAAKEDHLELICEATPHLARFSFLKTDNVDTKNGLSGAEFSLFTDEKCIIPAKAKDGQPIVMISDQNGKVQSPELPIAVYYLKETKAPEGYFKNQTITTIDLIKRYQEQAEQYKNGTISEISFDYEFPFITNQRIPEDATYLLLENDKKAVLKDWNKRTYDILLDINSLSKKIEHSEEREPVDVVLLLDNSTSMYKNSENNKSRIEYLKEAATGFINTMIYQDGNEENGEKTGSKIAITSFDNGVHELSNGSFSNNADDLIGIIQGMKMQESGTRTDLAMKSAYEKIQNYQGDKKVLVVLFTDGEPYESSSNQSTNAASIAYQYANDIKGKDKQLYIIKIGEMQQKFNLCKVSGTPDQYTVQTNQVIDRNITAKEFLDKVSTNPETHILGAANASELASTFLDMATLITTSTTKLIPVEGVNVTDILDSRFTLTEDGRKTLNDSGAAISENADGTTSICWTNQTIQWKDSATEDQWPLTFEVMAKEAYAGGNEVPTNAEGSKVTYLDEKNQEVNENFPFPLVNVRSDFKTENAEDILFLGESLKDYFIDEKVSELTGVLMNSDGVTIGLRSNDITVDQKEIIYTDLRDIRVELNWKDQKDRPVSITQIQNQKPSDKRKYTAEITVTPVKWDDQTVLTEGNSQDVMKSMESVNGNRTSPEGVRYYAVDPQMKTSTYEVYVVDGCLSITKKINQNYTTEAISEMIKDNQTFIFKIERFDLQNEKMIKDDSFGEVYETIDFAYGEMEKSKTLIGLTKGYYRITEETNWSWKYDPREDNPVEISSDSILNRDGAQYVLIGDRKSEGDKIRFTGLDTKERKYPKAGRYIKLISDETTRLAIEKMLHVPNNDEPIPEVVFYFFNHFTTDSKRKWFSDVSNMKNVFH